MTILFVDFLSTGIEECLNIKEFAAVSDDNTIHIHVFVKPICEYISLPQNYKQQAARAYFFHKIPWSHGDTTMKGLQETLSCVSQNTQIYLRGCNKSDTILKLFKNVKPILVPNSFKLKPVESICDFHKALNVNDCALNNALSLKKKISLFLKGLDETTF